MTRRSRLPQPVLPDVRVDVTRWVSCSREDDDTTSRTRHLLRNSLDTLCNASASYPEVWELEPEPAVTMDRAVDTLEAIPTRFHSVLMCRSGAWVPPWCDDDFTALAEAFPGKSRWIDNCNHPREFEAPSQERLDALAAGLAAVKAMM